MKNIKVKKPITIIDTGDTLDPNMLDGKSVTIHRLLPNNPYHKTITSKHIPPTLKPLKSMSHKKWLEMLSESAKMIRKRNERWHREKVEAIFKKLKKLGVDITAKKWINVFNKIK
jgi:hypothetical protein